MIDPSLRSDLRGIALRWVYGAPHSDIPVIGDDEVDTFITLIMERIEQPRMYRSGDMTCTCGVKYSKHHVEHHPWALAAEDEAAFHRLCNGDLVKL